MVSGSDEKEEEVKGNGRDAMQPTQGAMKMKEEVGESPIRVVGARELLGRRGVLRIELDGEIYTLRLTRNQRLILTK